MEQSGDNPLILMKVYAEFADLRRELVERLTIGYKRYNHGIFISRDTREYGTKDDSWLEMMREELLDAIIYLITALIRGEIDEIKYREVSKRLVESYRIVQR